MIYLDTSAFLKLYIEERGSETVQSFIMSQDDPLPVWEILQAEFCNALHLKVFWSEIESEQAEKLIGLFDERLDRGLYFVPEIDRAKLMATFRTLSRETPHIGCRTMDVLHVAYAATLGILHFVSFDDRQRTLASGSGLEVFPN